jgi:hypothetical protein
MPGGRGIGGVGMQGGRGTGAKACKEGVGGGRLLRLRGIDGGEGSVVLELNEGELRLSCLLVDQVVVVLNKHKNLSNKRFIWGKKSLQISYTTDRCTKTKWPQKVDECR